MTGFLNHLAGMATGDIAPGAVIPDLPPRFGWNRAPRTEPADAEPGDASSQQRAASPGLRPAVAGDDARGPALSPPPESPLAARAATAARSPLTPAPTHPAVERASTPPDRTLAQADRAAGPSQSELPPRARAAGDEAPPRAPEAGAIRSPIQPRPSPEASPRRKARPAAIGAPLTDAALAGRPTPRPEPTVVHVTIDRLDVRAPAMPHATPPATPGGPRQRPQPSISLSEYLGAGGSGASGAGRHQP